MKRSDAIRELTAAGKPYELVQMQAMGRPARVFLNAPPTLRDLFSATRSDLPFLVYEDERLTFEQVWQQTCTLAVHRFGEV